jgi:acyl-CoA thioesterase FadM
MRTYFEDLTTRGYEADPTRRVPLPMVFQYLEHLRWRSIIDPTSGLAPFVDQGYFFVVHKQSLVLRRGFGQDTDIRVYLWATKVGRSSIEMRHEVRRRSDNVVLAEAEVTGLWLGPTRRLSRIPDALRAFCADLEPPTPATPDGAEDHGERLETSFIRPPDVLYPSAPLSLEAPDVTAIPDDTIEYRCHVRPSDLDIFAHVNAATYLRYCDDARVAAEGLLGSAGRAACVQAALHYSRETLEGEEIQIRLWQVADDEVHFAMDAGGVNRSTAAMRLHVDGSQTP